VSGIAGVTFPDRPAREVVILGAGFSRAVSAAFPLTDELGALAVEHAQRGEQPPVPHPHFRDGSFETWLSRLADDQPHLSAEANLQNRALFLRISKAIRSVLADRQAEVLGADAPGWLYDLLSVLHVRCATVLTLNYDNLIECAVDGQFLYAWQAGRWADSSDILNGLPPLPGPAALSPQRMEASTFRLLKLHGSLSWFWSPDDATGATLQRWFVPGRFGAPAVEDEAERRRMLPGREPFIVPPAAVKSAYFRNLITRELWSQAFDALRSADRIIMVGYSLPVGDLTLAGMIGDAALDRDVVFEVVNPDPYPVCDRLRRMGVREQQIGDIDSGLDCVERFACRYRDQQARAVVEYLRTWGDKGTPTAGSLVLSWISPETGHPHMVQPIQDIGHPEPGTGDLILGPAAPRSMLTPRPSQLPELLARLPGASRLIGRTTRGRELAIIALWSRMQPGGEALRWISLVPCGRPDSS
jgi:SIR2-like domain